MHPSKRKGTRFEQELVSQARQHGICAQRAMSSDGRTIGHAPSVDILLEGIRVQAKRPKALPRAMRVPDGADVLIAREDWGEAVALMPVSLFFQLLAERVEGIVDLPRERAGT